MTEAMSGQGPVAQEYSPRVCVHESREELGHAAGAEAAESLRLAIARRGHARLMLAAAPSQQSTLTTLAAAPGVDWSGIECFHMDEYIGLPASVPQLFGNWLQTTFFDHVPPVAAFHRIGSTGDPNLCATSYESVMGSRPFDVVLLGLGVNGHLAFNDPPADLHDPRGARVVDLDETSRRQQSDEGHFATAADVPRRAITVTIPRLLNAEVVIASVPGRQKRQAVEEALTRPIGGAYPGTALRTHRRVTMHLDAESCPVRVEVGQLYG
ncbi:glucosamine-6-phosphate deaminase [Leifsonia sp. LS1]|jgi:glucosamine-6-phosphate deaminase|uniref:6-phosphogluconolactonase n=1 Tax=Leifsonia sp. LS1 TaxID=2828483 RepID=UPI001CFCE557|nr:6-phosphogluconolactonase [Leifsonia sp. LS1]GIT82197.1 glucosamine-6-phosphate deaminase [Leifsonia sp. LS1]